MERYGELIGGASAQAAIPLLPKRYRPLATQPMQGGFGSVIPVQDDFLGRTVLFKAMQDPLNNDQLLNEVRALSAARSRHVVEIYDVVIDKDGVVSGIIIEKLTGRDFNDFYTVAAKQPYQYLRALYQISLALTDLHNVGVVHRDLKVENLRESAAGILKLFDFGISCTQPDYRTTSNRGTAIYAAPELYYKNAVIGSSIDIYAFGICAWALGLGVFPQELLECPPQSTARAGAIADALPSLMPRSLGQLIDACLDPDPRGRPSARALSAELFRHLVKGMHRGIFTQSKTVIYELSSVNANVAIKIGSLGELKVHYDGFDFVVSDVTEHVYANNSPLVRGDKLHGACVLAFGASDLGWQRSFVGFSASHPEVIL